MYRSISGWPLKKGSKQIFRDLKKILLAEQDNPKFIFVNVMEMHEPYYSSDNPARLLADTLKLGKVHKDIKQGWKEGYRREAELFKKRILSFINFLKRYGLYDKVLIILTSDHDQLLGEHNAIGHGTFLYDELLRVPLLFRLPKEQELMMPDYINNKYYSHTRLKDLILGLISNNPKTLFKSFSDTVFAESYGLHLDLRRYLAVNEWNKIVKIYEKHKIAIYHKGCKGIFNASEGIFDIIECFGNLNKDIEREMLRKVLRFVRTGLKMRKLKGIYSL